MVSKIDEIREAARDYGRQSKENYEFCLQLKNDVILGLNRYLGQGLLGEGLATGVPPWDDWDPGGGDYRNEALDTFDDKTLIVRDIVFGVAIRIDNFNDRGCCWVRSRISVHKLLGMLISS